MKYYLNDKEITADEARKLTPIEFGEDYTILRELNEEEIKEGRIREIKQELTNLSQDFIQHDLGAIFEDIDERKNKFISLHNELRVLLGKTPREYITNNNI